MSGCVPASSAATSLAAATTCACCLALMPASWRCTVVSPPPLLLLLPSVICARDCAKRCSVGGSFGLQAAARPRPTARLRSECQVLGSQHAQTQHTSTSLPHNVRPQGAKRHLQAVLEEAHPLTFGRSLGRLRPCPPFSSCCCLLLLLLLLTRCWHASAPQ